MLAGLFLLPALALASPSLMKRDDASIVQAIGYINNNITAVNNTLNGFTKDNDSVTAIKIQLQANDLISSVNNADGVVNASQPLNDNQSFNVAVAVLNFQPNVNSLLDNIQKHKPQFDTAIFGFSASPLVKSTLQNSKAAADQFGKDLTGKLSATYQGAAPTIIKQIDAKFDEAITTFSS